MTAKSWDYRRGINLRKLVLVGRLIIFSWGMIMIFSDLKCGDVFRLVNDFEPVSIMKCHCIGTGLNAVTLSNYEIGSVNVGAKVVAIATVQEV